MKKMIGTLLVVAGVAASASAIQNSQFRIQLSTDGTNWVSDMPAFNPAVTPRLFARAQISYVQNDGPVVLFLNGVRFQPTVAGWGGTGDTVLPYDATGRVTADYSETDGDGLSLGRVFGATLVSAVQNYQYSFGGVDYLRLAEANAANHPGQGAGADNVSGSRGINTSQNPSDGIDGDISGVNLFTWGMEFAATRTGSLNFTIPQEAIRTSGPTAVPPNTRSSTWVVRRSGPFQASEAPTIDTIGATLTFVPAPGAAALLGLAGLVVGRRRR